jgi:hypothetical protein
MRPNPRNLTCLAAALAATAGCARHSGSAPGVGPTGLPRFETRLEIPTGTASDADFHVADFDGDEFLDMAVIGLSGEMRILLGNGTGFTAGQALTLVGLPIWITGGDLDGDGDTDLVVVRNAGNSTDVFWNDGNGNFTLGPSLPVGLDALAVVVDDINGDGNLDILVSRPVAPEIVVHLGNGAGLFTAADPISLPGGGSAFNLAVGDVTRDGVPDLLVADPALSRVLVYPGPGSSQPLGSFAYQLDVPGAPRAVSIGDLSGNGLPDMIVSAFEANRFVVVTAIDALSGPASNLLGSGGVVVSTYQSFDVLLSSAPSLSTIADVTGDGRTDLVACLGGQATMVVVPQLPSGGLGEPFQLDATGLPLRPFVGDFDRNGQNDLFALSGLGDRVNLWLARANGELSGARNYDAQLPTAPWIAGGDFDVDGQPEIAVGSWDSTLVRVMKRRPDGALEVVYSIDMTTEVMQLRSADLDFDGRMDLVVSVPGGLKLLRNRTSGGVLEFEILPGPSTTIGNLVGPFGLAVADLDRDGALDLIVCDYVGSAVHVIAGTATPFVFGTDRRFALPGGPIAVATADFTGDGQLDLAVSRQQLSDIVILQNLGSLEFSNFLTVPVGQAPNYLLAADFNRDGRSDLVVSNADSGSVTVLFGTGSGFLGGSFPAGQSPTALLAEDLTGDGRPDILVTSLVSGDFRVLVGNGGGSFPELVRFPGTLGATNAILQDMDGDGRLDLLIASLITNRVSLVRNIRQ